MAAGPSSNDAVTPEFALATAMISFPFVGVTLAGNGNPDIFSDGFESGATTTWSETVPHLPTMVDGLWGWWHAGSGVSTIDGMVSQWQDLSGNNRHWVQDSVSNRPRYVPTAHGGLPTIEWPKDVDAWMELPHAINPSQSDLEAFVVARSTPDLVWASLLQQRNEPGFGRAWLYFGGSDFSSYIGGEALTSIGDVDVFEVSIYHVSYDVSPQELELSKNGIGVVERAGVVAESCEAGMFLGREKIGRYLQGFIHELIIYDRVINPDERIKLVEYLQSKWKTVWSAAATSPIEIGNLWAWWRADTGVVTGVGGVESWADQSKQRLSLTQDQTDRRPQLTPNARNGLPGITFDNINDHLENLTDTLDFASESATIFVVMNTEDVGDAAPIGSLDGPTGTGRAWFENEPNVGRVYIGGFPAPLSLDGGRVIGPAILTVYFSRHDQVTQYAVNKWIWGLATNVIGEANTDGGTTRVGDTKSDLNDFNGDLYEIVVFNRALSWEERQQILNYLNGRWAVY